MRYAMSFSELEVLAASLGGGLRYEDGLCIVDLPRETWKLQNWALAQDILEIYAEEQFNRLLGDLVIDL